MLTALYFLFLICWGVSAFLTLKRSSKNWLFSMWGFWFALVITGWFI
jgi:hypothetical protein